MGQLMQDQTIGAFLEQLAARVPAPGGGAVAALHAAQAAALLGMVARYTTGPKYAEHAETVEELVEATDRWREWALALAEADAAAFGAVGEAYKLPKDTDEAKAARSAAIAEATVAAAQPPAEVVTFCLGSLLGGAQKLLTIGNRNVITDVAAAAEAIRAAAVTARVNIEVNLGAVTDPEARKQLEMTAGAMVDLLIEGTDAVTAAVRKEIAE
jgi:formiminotetrahydrofolate cyclodeaminase